MVEAKENIKMNDIVRNRALEAFKLLRADAMRQKKDWSLDDVNEFISNARKAVRSMRLQSKNLGLDKMTLEDINDEISKARNDDERE